MKSTSNKNNTIAFILFVIFIFIIYFLRFFQLGILKTANGVDLSQIDPAQYQESSIHHVRRGSLYDYHGLPIAVDTTSYSIHAKIRSDVNEKIVKDIDKAAKILSKYIDLSQDEILEILMTPNVNQVEFGNAGKDLSAATIRQISDENIEGIYFSENSKRQYVNDQFASHLIGYTKNMDDSEKGYAYQEGVMGIELAYDDFLNNYQTTNHQSILGIGQDLYLTLDSRLQNYLEELLDDSFERYKPENLSVYLVELGTNNLIASGQRPSFNLNNRVGIDHEWRHLLVENNFEPGSTIKILTQAYAYDNQLYSADEMVMTGSIDIHGTEVHDYNLTGWGYIPFDEGLIRSSNTSMVELVNRMGVNEWTEALSAFGFGRSTDSGLPNEQSGSIEFDNPVSATMSGFGQGLLVTPLQILEAYSSIGNQGILKKVNYINREKNAYLNLPPQREQRLFERKTAEHILQLLIETVESPFGTANDYQREDIKVAAKTGTAQIANPDAPGYLTGDQDYYFSVVSYFPAESPKYMLFISMKRPSESHGITGNKMLSELFHPFVDYIMLKN